MDEPIGLEQHGFPDRGDKEHLFEITHLNYARLIELDHHLTMSTVALSDDFKLLHRELKRLLSSLDSQKAS